MPLYKNNTGELSKIGHVCKVDSKDPSAFLYASAGANVTMKVGSILMYREL
jgi:hypothetical protein